MKKLIFILLILASFAAKSQKVESIHFNLYTDSLKKGVFNYINVDGKLATGSFLPLMADEVIFTSTSGKWEGMGCVCGNRCCLFPFFNTSYLAGKKCATGKSNSV